MISVFSVHSVVDAILTTENTECTEQETDNESGIVVPFLLQYSFSLLLNFQRDIMSGRVAGSHHIFKKGPVTFVIPVHKSRVKCVYVKRVIEIIEEERS